MRHSSITLGGLGLHLSKADKPSETKPGLAVSYEIDPNDHKRWIVHLRQGVTFHDGCKFTADDVVWNYQYRTDWAQYALHPSGTGPYRFDRFVPHQRLEMVPNTEYWDKARIPKQDRLVLIPMPEASTRTAALLTGQVNWIHCATASDRKIRSVDRETRWRWRLKVLWTAACTLRKRCADAADLKRCILRSRRRTT